MSVALSISLVGGTPKLDALMRRVSDRAGMNEQVGRATQNFVKRHLYNRDRTHPNKLGGDRTNFWEKAANKTTFTSDDSGAVITVAKLGIRLQYHGGTIVPGRHASRLTGKPTRLLSIPAAAEAHGRGPTEFDNLVARWGKPTGETKPRPIGLFEGTDRATVKGKTISSPGERAAKRAGDKPSVPSGRVIFWLVRKATIKPHPDVLPSKRDITLNAIDRLMAWLTRERARVEDME